MRSGLAKLKRKAVEVLGLQLVFAVLLFGQAATLAWPAAWGFLLLVFGPPGTPSRS